MEIQTSSVNFQRRVAVSASNDGETWRILEENGKIFHFSIPERGFSAGDASVQYPSSSARFLRVQIFDEDQEPLAIHGAVVLFARNAGATPPPPPAGHRRTNRRPRTQADDPVLLRASLPGFPADSIKLDIPHRNFYREVALEGSYDATYWIPLHSGEILYDFDTPRFVGDDRELRFGESRYLHYRITIFNEDNPPCRWRSPWPAVSPARSSSPQPPVRPTASTTGIPRHPRRHTSWRKLLPYLDTGDLPSGPAGPPRGQPRVRYS